MTIGAWVMKPPDTEVSATNAKAMIRRLCTRRNCDPTESCGFKGLRPDLNGGLNASSTMFVRKIELAIRWSLA